MKCYTRITKKVVEWVTNHVNNAPVYTDRIQEVDSDGQTDSTVVVKRGPSPMVPRVPEIVVNSHIFRPEIGSPMFLHCPGCQRSFSLISALINHIESEKCGLARGHEVNRIYTGMYATFKRLIKG